MIENIIVALILIAILCVITGAIFRFVPGIPPLVVQIAWVVITVICLLILLNVFTGNSFGISIRH